MTRNRDFTPRRPTRTVNGMFWRCTEPGVWRNNAGLELERRHIGGPVWYLVGRLPSGAVCTRMSSDFTESLSDAGDYIRTREQLDAS